MMGSKLLRGGASERGFAGMHDADAIARSRSRTLRENLVSGMIIGTMFTLLVVPSIYMLVAKTRVPASEMDMDTDSQGVFPEPEDAAA